MRHWLVVFAAVMAVSGCAAGAARDSFDDVASLQRRLDERGMGFGLTRVPGEDALLLQVRFRTSSDVGDETEATATEAAQAAAPAGCRVAAVIAQPDGTYKASYAC